MSNKLRAGKQKHQRRSGFIIFVGFFLTPGGVSVVAALVFISCNRPVSPLWMLQRVCVEIKQSGRQCLYRLKEICALLSEQQTSCLTCRDIFLCCVFFRGTSTFYFATPASKNTKREVGTEAASLCWQRVDVRGKKWCFFFKVDISNFQATRLSDRIERRCWKAALSFLFP